MVNVDIISQIESNRDTLLNLDNLEWMFQKGYIVIVLYYKIRTFELCIKEFRTMFYINIFRQKIAKRNMANRDKSFYETCSYKTFLNVYKSN